MSKELDLFGSQKMTVKEVAEILGYEKDYLRKKVKELFPEIVKNGIETTLDEKQVSILKSSLVPRTMDMKVQGINATTDIEMVQKTFEVIGWLQSKVNAMQEQLAIQAPKVEAYNCLMKTEKDMSITDACKHFGLHPKKDVFPRLREHGYLTQKDLPTQKAIDAGIMSLRQSEPSKHGFVYSQAVVKANQLEKFGLLFGLIASPE